MPLKIERALKKSARKKGIKPGSKRWGRYVYGGLRKITKRMSGHRGGTGRIRSR